MVEYLFIVSKQLYACQKNSSLNLLCAESDGEWLKDFKECEMVSKAWCDQNGGFFNECGLTCRHNEKADVCTMQCIPVCSFLPAKPAENVPSVKVEEKPIEVKPEEVKTTPEIYSYKDLIKIDSPLPGDKIKSPLVIEGSARGNWFFEGSFPVVLTNWDGLIIAQGQAKAEGEWMTEDYVKFKAELSFDSNQLYKRGALILKKDNPSGLPANDDAYEISVNFE